MSCVYKGQMVRGEEGEEVPTSHLICSTCAKHAY